MKFLTIGNGKSTSALQGLLLLLLADSRRLSFYQEHTQRSFVTFHAQASQKHWVMLFKKNLQLFPVYLDINTYTI